MAFLTFVDDAEKDVFVTFDATERETHVGTALISEHPIETGGNVTDHVRAENDSLQLDILITNTPLSENSHDAVGPDGEPMIISNMDGARGNVQAASLFFSRPPVRFGGPKLLVEGSPPDFTRPAAAAAALAGAGPGAVTAIVTLANQADRFIPAVPPVWEDGRTEQPASVADADLQVLQFGDEFDRVKAVFDKLNELRRVGQIVTITTRLRVYENMVIQSFAASKDATTGDSFRGTMALQQVKVVDSQTVQVTTPLEPRGQKQSKKGKQVPANSDPEEEKKGLTTIARDFLGQVTIAGKKFFATF